MKQQQLLALAIAACLYSSASVAESYTIAASTPDGQYTRVICPAIAAALHEKGFEAHCRVTSGSGENFTLVDKGQVAAGLIQKDALFGILESKKDTGFSRLIPLGELVPEAVWVVVLNPERGGRVTGFDTFTRAYGPDEAPERPYVIGVAGNEQSGAYLTMKHGIVDSIPGLRANVEAGHVKLEPLNRLTPTVAYHLLGTRLDAVMFVQMPDLAHPRIKTVLDSNGRYSFLDVVDDHLTQLRVAGQPVYQMADVPLQDFMGQVGGRLQRAWNALRGKGAEVGNGKSVHTVVTQATVLVDSQRVDSPFLETLSEIVDKEDLLPKNSLAATAARWWRNVKQASQALVHE